MRLVLFSLTAGVMAFLAVIMISPSYLLAGLIGLVATALPTLHIHIKRQKRLNKFLQLLPDALDLMSRGLSAGHAFTEALQMVSTEMPEPIASEFRKTYEEQNLGLSLKLALENLVERVPLLDLRMSRDSRHDSKRNRRQSFRTTRESRPHDPRALQDHGRSEDDDLELALVCVVTVCAANLSRDLRDSNEPRLHGRDVA